MRVDLVVPAVAIMVTAALHLQSINRVVAPKGSRPSPPIIRDRVAWTTDVASAVSAIAMCLVVFVEPSLRSRSFRLLPFLLLFAYWLLRIRRSEPELTGLDERSSEDGRLNAYPKIWPWSASPSPSSLRILLDALTPGVIVQLFTLTYLLR